MKLLTSKCGQTLLVLAALASAVAAAFGTASRGADTPSTWCFAVSGDSRNYGDVVMPAIAASVLTHSPKFYWHLGDFRIGYKIDEDISSQPRYRGLAIQDYPSMMWADFIEHQIKPFGTLPVYLGIGNHDVVLPKKREDFLAEFAEYLDRPELRMQRLKDDKNALAWRTYYHWTIGSTDFINLDNASDEQFDDAQLRWVEDVLFQDTQGPASANIKTIVVGMHRALPDSKSAGHSMNEASPQGVWSGRRVYGDLATALKRGKKNVYVLASHSHFFLDDVYATNCWKDRVIPGWIVGTAGAVHYPLPPGITESPHARTRTQNEGMVYGYLLGTVMPDSRIEFAFQQVSLDDVRKAAGNLYDDEVIRKAFSDNYTEQVDVHQATCPAP
jgi:hypothetical protein